MYVSVRPEGALLTVRRYHASLQRPSQESHLAGSHLVADIDDPDTQWPRAADVLLVPSRPQDGREPGARDGAGAEAAARHPGCSLVAVEERDGGCVALLCGSGVSVRARWSGPRPWWASAAIAASVVYERLLCGPDEPEGPGADDPGRPPLRLSVTIGADAEPALLVVAAL
jgi:hypothetical protein